MKAFASPRNRCVQFTTNKQILIEQNEKILNNSLEREICDLSQLGKYWTSMFPRLSCNSIKCEHFDKSRQAAT
jgi:hypothetical protein